MGQRLEGDDIRLCSLLDLSRLQVTLNLHTLLVSATTFEL